MAAAVTKYSWVCKIAQPETRHGTAYSCCLRCILEVTYGTADSVMAGSGANNIVALLDQFVNSVTEIDLEKVLEEVRPFAKEIWLKALETVAVSHKQAAKDLDLQTKVATVDDIRAATAPTEEQMAEARDRFNNQIEAEKNAEKYGVPQEAAKNTKERTAPKRNPLMRH